MAMCPHPIRRAKCTVFRRVLGVKLGRNVNVLPSRSRKNEVPSGAERTGPLVPRPCPLSFRSRARSGRVDRASLNENRQPAFLWRFRHSETVACLFKPWTQWLSQDRWFRPEITHSQSAIADKWSSFPTYQFPASRGQIIASTFLFPTRKPKS